MGQFDNSCQTYPGEIPPILIWTPEYVDGGNQYKKGPWTWLTGSWTTIIKLNDSIACDGIVDYCGRAISLTQYEGANDNCTVRTKEKRGVANDHAGNQPRRLK